MIVLCDGCKRTGDFPSTYHARKDGWIITSDTSMTEGAKDYCPRCAGTR